jgi:hypothetical protein
MPSYLKAVPEGASPAFRDFAVEAQPELDFVSIKFFDGNSMALEIMPVDAAKRLCLDLAAALGIEAKE